jgi:diaminopimelate decarboxylase
MASNYNSRFRPAEVLWLNDEAHLIRKEETFEDILHNQIILDFDKVLHQESAKA